MTLGHVLSVVGALVACAGVCSNLWAVHRNYKILRDAENHRWTQLAAMARRWIRVGYALVLLTLALLAWNLSGLIR